MSIPMVQHLTAVLISLSLITITIQLIRKRRLREEYAFGWLGISIVMLLLSIFGGIATYLTSLFAMEYPLLLILSVGLLATMIILLNQSVILTTQANHIRDLAQTVAILEWRLRQYEKAQETAVTPSTITPPTPNGHTTYSLPPKAQHHDPIN